MRRFSSEGSLLELDFLPWKRSVSPRNKGCTEQGELGTYTPHQEDKVDGGSTSLPCTPVVQEPGSSGRRKGELDKEHSISLENLTDLEDAKTFLRVSSLSDSFRAYSDGQIASDNTGRVESMRAEHLPQQSPSSSPSTNFSSRSLHRQQAKAKLATAKLHLKSLFGQSPHSSHSNLTATDHRDRESSATDRRSRLPFLRQWSQVSHSRSRVSREEVELWATSLNALLDSRMGVPVFGAFLRSEFSEENLQFYLACEQYRNSSNNFTLQRRARDICATYIQPGAPREVNLDCKTRDLTLQLLQAPSHNSLSHAQKRIYCLLDTDCYPRFLHSPIYLKLLEEAF